MQDNSCPIVEQCFPYILYCIRAIGLCRNVKGSILLKILLLTSHGFVDESWMGAPTDLAGVDERAPISKTLPHVAGIEGLEPGPHLSASIFISLCDLPALLDPWGNPGQ
jgi:hypothetical protein